MERRTEREAYQCEVAAEKEEEKKCIMKILELIIAVKVGQEIPYVASHGTRYSLKAWDA